MTPDTLASVGAALGLQTKAYVAEAMTKAIAAVQAENRALQATIDRLEARLAVTSETLDGLSKHVLGAAPVDVGAIAAQAAALIPIPSNGRDGKDAPPVDVDAIAKQAAALVPVPRDGRDAPPVDLAAIAQAAAALVPTPAPGRDGQDAPPLDLDVVAMKAAAMVPVPAPVDVPALVKELVAAIPVPRDGRDGVDGRDGQDAPPVDLDALAKSAAALVPVPAAGRDGADAPPVDIAAVARQAAALVPVPDPVDISAIVKELVSTLPAPRDGKDGKDGRDGTSVTIADVQPIIKALVEESRVEPIGVQDALIDQAGDLILTFTDGRIVKAGHAKGADADPDVVTKQVADAVDRIPRPKDGTPGKDGIDGKDGRDGVSFDDISHAIDEARNVVVVSAKSGDRTHVLFEAPLLLYRGVYKAGERYCTGQTATYKGELWICRKDTYETPGDGPTNWSLAVRRGRDGRGGRGGS